MKKNLIKLIKKLFLRAVKYAAYEEIFPYINKAMWESIKLNGDNISKLFVAYNINNKTFEPFKRCHEGKSIVIVGAGPSLNDFVPIPNAIYIGLNRAFLYEKIKFDYLFSIDRDGIMDYHKSFFEYSGEIDMMGGVNV